MSSPFPTSSAAAPLTDLDLASLQITESPKSAPRPAPLPNHTANVQESPIVKAIGIVAFALGAGSVWSPVVRSWSVALSTGLFSLGLFAAALGAVYLGTLPNSTLKELKRFTGTSSPLVARIICVLLGCAMAALGTVCLWHAYGRIVGAE